MGVPFSVEGTSSFYTVFDAVGHVGIWLVPVISAGCLSFVFENFIISALYISEESMVTHLQMDTLDFCLVLMFVDRGVLTKNSSSSTLSTNFNFLDASFYLPLAYACIVTWPRHNSLVLVIILP